jgi:hypothetical protein
VTPLPAALAMANDETVDETISIAAVAERRINPRMISFSKVLLTGRRLTENGAR